MAQKLKKSPCGEPTAFPQIEFSIGLKAVREDMGLLSEEIVFALAEPIKKND